MALDNYLQNKGFQHIEGNSGGCKEQQDRLQLLAKTTKKIMEIGFNAGHSSLVFLQSSDATIVSFDLGYHSYVSAAKEYLDLHYPNRHTLIIGNSIHTIPAYKVHHHEQTFDIIFIDGGHDYVIARTDLQNCQKLAHHDTIVVMDDVVSEEELHQDYTRGPTRAWNEAVQDNRLITLGQENYGIGRGMIWGKYLQ